METHAVGRCYFRQSVKEQVEVYALMTSFYDDVLLSQIYLCAWGLSAPWVLLLQFLNWQSVGDWHQTEGLISSRLWYATCWKIYSDKCHPVLLNMALKDKLSPCQELPLWTCLLSARTDRPDVSHWWEKVSGTRKGLAASGLSCWKPQPHSCSVTK